MSIANATPIHRSRFASIGASSPISARVLLERCPFSENDPITKSGRGIEQLAQRPHSKNIGRQHQPPKLQ